VQENDMIPPYSPSNSIIERVRRLFKKQVNDGALAFLGDSSLAGARIDVPGRPGYVYARWPDERDVNGFALYSQPFMVRSSSVAYPNIPGAAVYVAVKYNNELEIVSANYAGLDRLGVNTAVLNPLNQQSKWVYPWQLTMGLASAVATAVTGSTLVMVKSFRHYVGDVFNTFETPLQADKIDLSSYIPGLDEHCYAAVWIDTYTNLPVVTTSTPQDINTPLDDTDLQELIVTAAQSRPADGIPLKAFYLSDAQGKISQNALDVDLRQILNNPVPWGFPNVLTTLERVWPDRTLVVGPYAVSGVGALALESGAQVIIVHKNNFIATVPPTINDDSGDGYTVGSLWFDTATGNLYVAVDVTAGAADWEAVALGSGTDPYAVHVNVDAEIVGIAAKTALVADDTFILEDSEDSDAKKSTTMDDIASAVVLLSGSAYALIQDQKTQNTPGGNFTSGADRTRTLNTIVSDSIGVSLSSDQITLPAGTYQWVVTAPTQDVDRHQALLYNVTDAAVVQRGTSTFSASSIPTSSMIMARVTITSLKAFEIRHRCQTTHNTTGFGLAANFGTEIYTSVQIIKE
jgi:hypothetical protein